MSSSLRKNTAEELRASEMRYRTFVDHATDAFMLHAEDGTVIDVNPQACDNLGYSRDELIGMAPIEFDPSASSDLLENINEQLNRGEIVTFESRHRRKDGSDFPVEVRIRPFWHGGRRLNISVVRDISDRKRAEEAVRRSERELRELIETIPAMAFAIGCDGSIEFVSRQWIEFSGMSAEQTTGEAWAATLHPDDREEHIAKWRAAHASGEPFENEARHRDAQGSYRWLLVRAVPSRDEKGAIVKWYGALTDITDRKSAEALLAGERRLFELIATGVPLKEILNELCLIIEQQRPGTHASALMLTREGHHLTVVAGPTLPKGWSDQMEKLPVGPCAGSCGTAAYRGTLVIASDIATDPLWDVPEHRAAALSHGLRASWSNPVLCSNGKVAGTFCIYYREPRSPTSQDLELIELATHVARVAIERDQQEISLREAQSELAHVSRVTTVGEFAASIAHEVNQPLAGILTNAKAALRWLARNSPDLAEAQQAIDRIIRDGNRAGDVISRMRALFKKAPAAKEPVDINLVIQEVLTLIQPELQKNRVSLRTQFAVDLPTVPGDKVQLQQVILNLVVNAIEAMSGVTESQRELQVSSQKITESHSASDQEAIEAKASSEPGPTSLLIAVRDAGPGLDPTELKRVFETFYTTKSHGMGMGLAISRSIIEAHNGRLWVTANAPRGTVFQFTLPCIPD
ncbi:MAG: PAS domain S-box protein [Verrucomicrobia bacterium]|nr:PAS domain S-box protein [Verrucomicrobiota bacterium]